MIRFNVTTLFSCLLGLQLSSPLLAQVAEPFQDLSFWRPTNAANWQVAGAVTADPFTNEAMQASKGKGVLVNLPDSKNRANLISAAEYGDVEVAFDFMMARHSNSGFYLQGRYEVQLLDSWGKLQPTFGDCGGIYARRRFVPKEELFEGYPPIQNACAAPGLWQRMEISFRAPRFDASGKKINNARITVRLNGVLVQDNRELTGPTGGPISEQEAARGPFMIQGDHGPVAFRNLEVKEVGSTPPVAGPVSYEVVYGNFREIAEFKDKKAELMGTSEALSWELARKENGFALRCKMNLEVKQPGKYTFQLQAGGNSVLTVAGKELLAKQWTGSNSRRTATMELSAGAVPMEVLYYKMDGWLTPILALWVEGPDGSRGALHTLTSTLALTPSDPIYLDAATPTTFRSFMDYYEKGDFKKRIVHAVNVGHPSGVHYTYDLDNGALAQLWKGAFLNTSPMWDNRGDGSARPRGSVLAVGDYPALCTFEELTAIQSDLPPVSANFRPLGYDVEQELPVFRYQFAGIEVNDRWTVTDQTYLKRTMELKGAPSIPLYCRLAVAATIEEVKPGLYAVDQNRYYVQVPAGQKPQIVERDGLKVLCLPAGNGLSYSILW
ncbi:MAG: family 16 glycoside hydrolase [Chitinophagales bacterium]